MFLTYSKYINILIFITLYSCSIMDDIAYHPKINQGACLSNHEILKIKNGMTKQQIIYLLGTPTLKQNNLDSSTTWYYILNKQNFNKQKKQKIFLIEFNTKNKAKNIKTIFTDIK